MLWGEIPTQPVTLWSVWLSGKNLPPFINSLQSVHLFRNEWVGISVSLLDFGFAYRHLVERTSEKQSDRQ